MNLSNLTIDTSSRSPMKIQLYASLCIHTQTQTYVHTQSLTYTIINLRMYKHTYVSLAMFVHRHPVRILVINEKKIQFCYK